MNFAKFLRTPFLQNTSDGCFCLLPLHNWMTRFEAGVTGSPRDVSEGKWLFGGGIEIPCTYKVYGRIYQENYMCQKN